MKLDNLPAGITEWSQIAASVAPGDSGTATARARQFGSVQVRLVEYSADYVADHWCTKGHIVFVVAGSLTIEHNDAGGEKYVLTPGMSYHVSDGGPPHRVLSRAGATIFIVD